MAATTGIVVVNFASHALVEANLSALDLSVLDAEVFVVDNHRSDADSAAMAVVARRHGWRLLEMGRNAGFGTGVNAGAEAALVAGCDVLLVLNPDLAVTTETAAAMAAAVREDPKAMISPRIVRPNGAVWFDGGFISLDQARTRSIPGPDGERTPAWLSGAALAVHSDLWAVVDGFDDDYFLYWEDVDLSYRVRRAGGRLVVRHDLEAVHDVGGTQHAADSRRKSGVYYYYNCRNRLLFAAKHLGRRDRLLWLLRTPADMRRVLLRGGRRQFVSPGTTLWPALRGAGAGVTRLASRR